MKKHILPWKHEEEIASPQAVFVKESYAMAWIVGTVLALIVLGNFRADDNLEIRIFVTKYIINDNICGMCLRHTQLKPQPKHEHV
jgi:hypothetical protein